MDAAENILGMNEVGEPAAGTAVQQVEQLMCRTLTVLSTAPEKRRPLDTARAVTLPWCLSRVCVQIMLSMLHTWITQTQLLASFHYERDVFYTLM